MLLLEVLERLHPDRRGGQQQLRRYLGLGLRACAHTPPFSRQIFICVWSPKRIARWVRGKPHVGQTFVRVVHKVVIVLYQAVLEDAVVRVDDGAGVEKCPVQRLCVVLNITARGDVKGFGNPPPREPTQQDWVLKCLQGGRAHPLAACGVGDALLPSTGCISSVTTPAST
jgi:hypothetical protein